MSVLYIDADACPVKAEAEAVATRHKVAVKMVCNGGLRPSANPTGRMWQICGSRSARGRGMW